MPAVSPMSAAPTCDTEKKEKKRKIKKQKRGEFKTPPRLRQNRLQELKGFFVKRGYNSEFVEGQFDRVRILDRSALFNQESRRIRRKNNKVLLL